MATLKQMAEKKNARDSKGSVESIYETRRKELKCGIEVDRVTCPWEKPEELAALIEEHYARFNPADVIERSMVDMLIMDEWRLRRYSLIEEQLIAISREQPERFNEKALKSCRAMLKSIRKCHKDTLVQLTKQQKSPWPPRRPAAPEPPPAEPEPAPVPYQLHWIN